MKMNRFLSLRYLRLSSEYDYNNLSYSFVNLYRREPFVTLLHLFILF